MLHTLHQVAEECLKKAGDLSGLLLLYSARGSEAGLEQVASAAQEAGKHNVAFLARLLLGRLPECVDQLIAAGRIPEAAFFARTYLPSRVSEVGSGAHGSPLLGPCSWGSVSPCDGSNYLNPVKKRYVCPSP